MFVTSPRTGARGLAPLAAGVLALFAISPAARAQTDYFWNAPTGNSGTWDLATQNWSTVAAGPVNYTWTGSGIERANFGNTVGTVTLGTNITAYGINFSTANYVIADGGFTLTLAGTGGPVFNNVAATISAPIAGTVGLTKTGSGVLTLSGANTYSGGTTVSGGGTLLGVAQAAGSPFSSGPVSLTLAAMRLNGIAASTTTTVGDFTIGAPSANNTGAASLVVDNTVGGAGALTTLAAGNLIRGGVGSVLVVTPATGNLGIGGGTGEAVTFTNGNALVTNTILPPWVVATATGTNLAADFVTHGANGLTVATYFGGDLTTSTNASVVNQTTAPNIAGPVAAYALKASQPINLNGNTLTLGNGSGQSGLILNNGGAISGGPVTFGPTEGVVYLQGVTNLGAIGDTITSNGLTVSALGAASATINGTIVNGTLPARLLLTGTTSGVSITLGGANTYSGGTTLEVNTGANGNIFVGADTAFGTGKVTNILVPGTSSPQMQALGGARTIANAFDLNGGLTFTGTNSFAFTGPINVINSASGGTRTLNSTIVTAGTSVTFGASPGSSTITLGNPVANGGDGIGKAVVFTPSANALIVINDVMQDPASGGGAASGSVQYGGNAAGVVKINSLNTYSGSTVLNGGSTLQFNHDYNGGDPSGPFGVGTLVPNNSTNNILQPVGGNRTIANPISMATGFTVANAVGDTSSLTFTGPIAMQTTGRVVQNNMAAGATLTLGAAASPSTFTMSTAAAQTLTFAGAGTTVVNDTIKDATGVATNITVTATGAVTFNGVINSAGLVTISSSAGTITMNALNTYSGGTALTGPGTIIPILLSSNGLPGSFTAGPFGTGQINFNNGTNQHLRPVGNQTISNPLLLTTGFAMDTAVGDTTSSLTFAGPITMTNNRFISNGFVIGQAGGTLIIGSAAAPSTVTLPVSSNFTLSFAALNGPIVVNDVLQNAAGQTNNVTINPNGGDTNTVSLNAVNTYTGTTTIGGGAIGGGTVQLGTNQPFGTGTVVMNNTAGTSGTPPTLQPGGADRTIANAITMTSGFFATNAPGTAFNLTLTGPISLTTNNRTLTNNMAGTLTLGSAASPSTITLGTAAGFQLQVQSQSGTGTTVINDVIQDPGPGATGSFLVSSGAVLLTNANTYSGGTTVAGGKLVVNNTTGSGTGTGAVTVTGSGTVGSGGLLGGSGTISGLITISSPAAGSQGGIISPGNSPGTLNIGSMTWNPVGQYNFEHNATNTTTGGTTNDFINGSGTLDLSGLTPGSFNINLLPTNFAPTLTQQTYTIATFSLGIIGPGGPFPSGSTDASSLFTLGGTFSSNPAAFATIVGTLGGPQSLQITFTPVPEPAFILAACGGLTALAAWRRRRRRA